MFVSFNKNANHKYCSEDFTSEYEIENIGYAMLSDGCSSSNGDVIYGTRLFHKSTKNNLNIVFNSNSKHKNTYMDTWHKFIFATNMQYHSQNIDYFQDNLFTLLSIHFDKQVNLLDLHFLGDGYCYIEDNDGNKNIIKIEYENNTPMYVSYLCEENLDSIQLIKHGDCDICINDSLNNLTYGASFRHSDIKKIFLFSDGIDQISDMDANEFIEQICMDDRYGSDVGFLRRKANKLLKNKTCNDDVSFIGYINNGS